MGEVQNAIQEAAGSCCNKVIVFDIYEKGIVRSVSFRMQLTPSQKTAFKDEDLKKIQERVIKSVTKKFPVRLT